MVILIYFFKYVWSPKKQNYLLRVKIVVKIHRKELIFWQDEEKISEKEQTEDDFQYKTIHINRTQL